MAFPFKYAKLHVKTKNIIIFNMRSIYIFLNFRPSSSVLYESILEKKYKSVNHIPKDSIDEEYLPFFYDMGNFKNMTLLVSHKYTWIVILCCTVPTKAWRFQQSNF